MIKKLKESSKKIITRAIIITFILSPLSLLFAEDFPSGYLGAGYREYLNSKVQNGYYVEAFTKMDRRQKEQVDKRNQVEQILTSSYQATPVSSQGILSASDEQKQNSNYINAVVVEHRSQREQVASAQGDFNYIAHSDGKVEYFKDGLVSRVDNERVVDEFGNVNIKNSRNYQYDDNRLLTGFEADVKDSAGNTTHVVQSGMKYAPDSVFYASDDTNVNKNVIEYTLEETDPLGNKKTTHFSGGTYEGKLLRSFSQTIQDAVYGNTSFTRTDITYDQNKQTRMSTYHEYGKTSEGYDYTLSRTNTSFNDKDQATSYSEKITTFDTDGSVMETAATDAVLEYKATPDNTARDIETPDPDLLLKSTTKTVSTTTDGSIQADVTVTEYQYDANNKIISASGVSNYSGSDVFGNINKGSSYMYYDLYNGRPELTKTTSQTDYFDKDLAVKHEEETTEYTRNWYGYLTGASGSGSFSGNDAVGNSYTGIYSKQYEIINGRAMLVKVND